MNEEGAEASAISSTTSFWGSTLTGMPISTICICAACTTGWRSMDNQDTLHRGNTSESSSTPNSTKRLRRKKLSR